MQKYINMNDSFGGKNTVTSTKSFQNSYEECLQSLQEQVQNHKNALYMAQQLLYQYKHENQRLINQLETIRQKNVRTEQKYEVLQKLFIKLDSAKDRSALKQNKRSQEKHYTQIQRITQRYQAHIQALDQKIYALKMELQKHHLKEKQSMFEHSLNEPFENIRINVPVSIKQKQAKSLRRWTTQKDQDLMLQIYLQNKIKANTNCAIGQYINNETLDSQTKLKHNMKYLDCTNPELIKTLDDTDKTYLRYQFLSKKKSRVSSQARHDTMSDFNSQKEQKKRTSQKSRTRPFQNGNARSGSNNFY